MPTEPPPITLLQRREIEAKIVGPLIRGFVEAMGRDAALEVVRRVIAGLAREGGCRPRPDGSATPRSSTFAHALDLWREGGALEIDLLEQSPDRLSFNVTRCRYAELYRALGLADLGGSLSCRATSPWSRGSTPTSASNGPRPSWKGRPTVTSASVPSRGSLIRCPIVRRRRLRLWKLVALVAFVGLPMGIGRRWQTFRAMQARIRGRGGGECRSSPSMPRIAERHARAAELAETMAETLGPLIGAESAGSPKATASAEREAREKQRAYQAATDEASRLADEPDAW